jgi:hypothetical protein
MAKTNDGPATRWPGILASAASLLLVGSATALADEHDTFEISIGGYDVYRYDSTVSLTETNAGIGISFSPRDTLGLDSEQAVFRLDGLYRFRPKHAITFSWYRLDASAGKTLVDDIEWVDEEGNTVIIPTGTSVSSSLDNNIVKIGYLWSFYQSGKVELAAGAGLHWADIALELAVESGVSGTRLRGAKSDLPMPVLSFTLEYELTQRTEWYLTTEFFALSLDEWRGLYSDFQLGLDYQLFDHVAAGVALGSNSLDVDREKDDTRFRFDNRISGIFLYVSANF